MTQPPSSESGNVVDPAVLSARRARRAEVSEDTSLELRLFEAERRLGEVAAERDALRSKVAEFERDLRGTRQREWAEQQQRLEAQGETAATRELAGAQLASLRERLAEAEAEVAVVAVERDRARKALEDERLHATAERERREALEREGLLLRAEIARRDDVTRAAVSAVSAARRELAAREDVGAIEARIAVERREFAARVVAVERAVLAVRERLGAAARVLKERLEAERSARVAAESALGAERTGRVAAEAALDGARMRAAELERAAAGASARTAELERELERRAAVEAQLRAALDALNAELAAVRAGGDERVTRLTARVESVVALATRLRGEASAEQESLAASLEAMRTRVAELQSDAAASADLRAELEAERAARWVAEAELDAERRRGDADRAARASAEAELAALRTASAPDPGTVASLREALSQLQAPAAEPNPALGLDLSAAAARLRAESTVQSSLDALEAHLDAAPEPYAPDDPFTPTVAGPRPPAFAPPEDPAPVEDVAPVVDPAPRDDVAVDEPAPRDAVPELAPAVELPPRRGRFARDLAPDSDSGPISVVVAEEAPEAEPAALQPLPERAAIATPGPWLRDALRALAVDEPDIAELLVVSLLPAQGGLLRGALEYEFAVDGGTTHRILVDADGARIGLQRGDAPDVCVSGPLAALVPLVAGGAGWRLPGARVQGRRQLRKLLKARRRPLGLAELAAAGVAPSPGLLLTVLAQAVDPRWTVDRPLEVDVAATGADRWRVVADGRSPLAILPAEGAPPAGATLHTSAGRLPAVLAGTAAPGDAHVEGDVRDLRTLLSWLDRAQREPR
jgi:hypothetical protein